MSEIHEELRLAHQHSFRNRAALQASENCGCFFCLRIYSPTLIQEWTDGNETALCPHCGVDSVIGAASGCPMTKAFLAQMHQVWF